MKKNIYIVLLSIVCLITTVCMVACGPEKIYNEPEYAYVTSLHGERIDLHIKSVQRNILTTFNGERNLSYFNSYCQNLSEISEALTAADENNVCESFGEFLLVKDTEHGVSTLIEYDCSIEQRRPSESNPDETETYFVYTYTVRNMGGWITDSDCFVMIPAHLIKHVLTPDDETRLSCYTIKNGMGYTTEYAIEDFEEFYTFNGYEVQREGDILEVTDPAPKKLSAEVYDEADRTRPEVLTFTIKVSGGVVTFSV